MLVKEAINILCQGTREENPTYIGSGSHCDAYIIAHHDHKYVIKHFHHFYNIVDTVNDAEIHIDLYNKAKGIVYVPQLVGSSLENRFLICEYIDGELLSDLDVCSLDSLVFSTAIYHLIDTYCKLYDAGLKADAIKSNFKYFNKRFYIIDFSLKTYDDIIEKEILNLPILLSTSYVCLMHCIELIFNQLSYFEELSQQVQNYVDSNFSRVFNYELNYEKLVTINLKNAALKKAGKYVQYLYQVKRRLRNPNP